ncbi:PREDICTED: DNA-binding protein HEXBP-like isoform X1 [Camelina sativa]|uniref:DNA-binding protein HEXBP-like isoform X1 n=2 Tax=Camelina sativa TaxID=90675 RepID=A0ABM1QK95_CAMSA|nr:PREDICTED: DNA-binding protein HEXBP-like isoform X1 [Camelina sativa]
MFFIYFIFRIVNCGSLIRRPTMSSAERRSRKIHTDRFAYRDDPYRRDLLPIPSFSQDNTCNNCKRPGHFARDCPHVSICHNCGLPGHIVSECSTKSLCWNCREPGHMANSCTNEGICHSCGIAGHRAKGCTARQLPPGDLRLCNNCYKQGHFAADCTNEKACNNCRMTGHLARDCRDDPVCNLCNVAGHLAVKCPKTDGLAGDRRPRGIRGVHRRGGYNRDQYEEDIVCRNYQQMGHMSRDCTARLMICRNCGGRGHIAYDCPSARFVNNQFPLSFDFQLLKPDIRLRNHYIFRHSHRFRRYRTPSVHRPCHRPSIFVDYFLLDMCIGDFVYEPMDNCINL